MKLRLPALSPVKQLIFLLLLPLTACGEIGADVSPSLKPRDLAIVVNTADPLSVKIGEYYQRRRRIPDRNWIEIELPHNQTTLTPQAFHKIQKQVHRQTPRHVQAYALTWAEPYRVGCMSITSAFAFGFDEAHCAESCEATASNPYFNHTTVKPYQDLKMRPTMAIAATTFPRAKALINRGIRSDYDRPQGTAYLLSTSDAARNVRAGLFPQVLAIANGFAVKALQADSLKDRQDVMFYFTGSTHVKDLKSNRFLPGAVADHLTSYGGMLTDSRQMSSLHWLEAGATGSYGAVIEPCNFPQKFPHPAVLINHYRRGDALIEAYWKSVAWPGQGIFIGEPLAKPFR